MTGRALPIPPPGRVGGSPGLYKKKRDSGSTNRVSDQLTSGPAGGGHRLPAQIAYHGQRRGQRRAEDLVQPGHKRLHGCHRLTTRPFIATQRQPGRMAVRPAGLAPQQGIRQGLHITEAQIHALPGHGMHDVREGPVFGVVLDDAGDGAVLRTAVSDLEVDMTERDGHLWHIRYPFADGPQKAADGTELAGLTVKG